MRRRSRLSGQRSRFSSLLTKPDPFLSILILGLLSLRRSTVVECQRFRFEYDFVAGLFVQDCGVYWERNVKRLQCVVRRIQLIRRHRVRMFNHGLSLSLTVRKSPDINLIRQRDSLDSVKVLAKDHRLESIANDRVACHRISILRIEAPNMLAPIELVLLSSVDLGSRYNLNRHVFKVVEGKPFLAVQHAHSEPKVNLILQWHP